MNNESKRKVYIPDLYLRESKAGKKYGKRIIRAAKMKELAEQFAGMAASGKDFDLLGFFGQDDRDPQNVSETIGLSLSVHEEIQQGAGNSQGQVSTPW